MSAPIARYRSACGVTCWSACSLAVRPSPSAAPAALPAAGRVGRGTGLLLVPLSGAVCGALVALIAYAAWLAPSAVYDDWCVGTCGVQSTALEFDPVDKSSVRAVLDVQLQGPAAVEDGGTSRAACSIDHPVDARVCKPAGCHTFSYDEASVSAWIGGYTQGEGVECYYESGPAAATTLALESLSDGLMPTVIVTAALLWTAVCANWHWFELVNLPPPHPAAVKCVDSCWATVLGRVRGATSRYEPVPQSRSADGVEDGDGDGDDLR